MPYSFELILAFAAALVAGMMNAIAGGGTLITFPSLLGLGLASKIANATSTLGLWPGSLGGAWGYRREIARLGQGFGLFFVPSLLGGTTGAVLLLVTRTETFDLMVPWLILGATVLFMIQGRISRWLRARQHAAGVPHGLVVRRWWIVVPLQFLVGVYGGYFGAGIGILMLAALGLLGLDDIHQMNGVKNIAALCINGMAVVLFAFSGLVDWPVAAVMSAGALLGGYLGARLAKRVGPTAVRVAVVFIGLVAAGWTAARQFDWTR